MGWKGSSLKRAALWFLLEMEAVSRQVQLGVRSVHLALRLWLGQCLPLSGHWLGYCCGSYLVARWTFSRLPLRKLCHRSFRTDYGMGIFPMDRATYKQQRNRKAPFTYFWKTCCPLYSSYKSANIVFSRKKNILTNKGASENMNMYILKFKMNNRGYSYL